VNLNSKKESSVRPLLYFAAPLFSQAERQFNAETARLLGSAFDVYLPQEVAGLVAVKVAEGIDTEEAFRAVFKLDLQAIRRCDVVLAVLDGRTVDEGVAFELGFAYSLGIPCIGLQTDSRRMSPLGNNPMIECSLEMSFASVSELCSWSRETATTRTWRKFA
jgi:nucleoside 2-deoxyribosyltransferase